MFTRNSLVICNLACAAVALTSCRESAAPPGPTNKATIIAPASPTLLTGTVGSPITELPSVTVQDSNGNAVGGVVVTFTVSRAGGTITGPRAVSNSAGIASVAGWTLATVPGMNVLTATAGSGDTVVFRANAVAGPPFFLKKLDGDWQTAQPGTALGVRPRVRVTDAYGNELSGVTVTFAVEAGGGSLARAVAVSDSIGIAVSGIWTLGPLGDQRVVARAGAVASEPFTANVIVPPFTCARFAELPPRITSQSELTPLSCKTVDGRPLDVFTITVTEPSAYVFRMESTKFDTYLELRARDLTPLARSDNSKSGSTNSQIKALLPPGTYTLVASAKVAASGSYTVWYDNVSSRVENCEEVFIVRGVTTSQVSRSTDCTVRPYTYADEYRIHLETGTTVWIQVDDLNYSGPAIELITPAGNVLKGAEMTAYVQTLIYTASAEGFYTLLVGLVNDENAQYVLAVRRP